MTPHDLTLLRQAAHVELSPVPVLGRYAARLYTTIGHGDTPAAALDDLAAVLEGHAGERGAGPFFQLGSRMLGRETLARMYVTLAAAYRHSIDAVLDVGPDTILPDLLAEVVRLAGTVAPMSDGGVAAELGTYAASGDDEDAAVRACVDLILRDVRART